MQKIAYSASVLLTALAYLFRPNSARQTLHTDTLKAHEMGWLNDMKSGLWPIIGEGGRAIFCFCRVVIY